MTNVFYKFCHQEKGILTIRVQGENWLTVWGFSDDSDREVTLCRGLRHDLAIKRLTTRVFNLENEGYICIAVGAYDENGKEIKPESRFVNLVHNTIADQAIKGFNKNRENLKENGNVYLWLVNAGNFSEKCYFENGNENITICEFEDGSTIRVNAKRVTIKRIK